MKIYKSLKSIQRPLKGAVVAVGIFDGVHVGHMRIIKSLVRRAKALRKKSVVLTFFPHPFSILYPKKTIPLLSSLDHRLRLLKSLGVDIIVLIRFNKGFANMRPETFVSRVLMDKLNMKEMLVGEDFIFGRRGGGDTASLKRLAKKHGFKFRKITLLKIKGKAVSSTYIRALILKGKLKKASHLLGRPVSILGTVKQGTKIGRMLGFPTANIDPHHEAIPPSGVYAVRVTLDKSTYKGIVNIGFRPTFHPPHYAPEPTIEVHIMNFKKDIYGRDLEIIFTKRIRPEKRFKDRESLKRRITLDVEAARKIL